MREQNRARFRRLREPTQKTIAIRSTVLPSEGRLISPAVGPRGLRIHSSSGPVTTFG